MLLSSLSRNEPVLTSREKEVLEYVILGLSAKEVARYLEISPRTVDRHVENVRLKLRARNRTHMVACAIQAGFLDFKGGMVRRIGRATATAGAA